MNLRLATCFLLLTTTFAHARVARIEIVERIPFADGMEFGDVGAYEMIRGRLHYAIPPGHARNKIITDLRLAASGRLRSDNSTIRNGKVVLELGTDPRNSKGEVTFAGDFILIKPVHLERGNHRLLYDVNNRGNLLMLGYYNKAAGSNRPRTKAHAGNGWLMRQGYSLLWSAWNWDVERVGGKPLRVNLPIVVKKDGRPMTGMVNAELTVQSRAGRRVERLAWGGSRCYPVNKERRGEAVLTERPAPDAERRIIPRDQWQFATLRDGKPVFNPVHVYFDKGYKPGFLYEVVYPAMHPRVVGLGLAAVRDAISFFHYESADEAGTKNPLLRDGKPDSEFAYIFGISQSGRFITHMIYQGFHVDEKGRLVFEGARPHVAGGGKGGFNYRFAQTTHHQKHLQGNDYPADHFPFHFARDEEKHIDPHGKYGRTTGDVLDVAKTLGKIPKIMIANHEGEYWTRSASLVHTDVAGKSDAELHENVRVYMVNGARHGTPGRSSVRRTSTSAHYLNQLDASPVGRALLVRLDEWVSQGTEPPASRVPRLDRGQLISSQAHAKRFPKIPQIKAGDLTYPAARHPGANLNPPRIDFGPRFWSEGIQDYVPPRRYGPRFVTLVPNIDDDGNPLGGIRLPMLEVPLGSFTAFNPRKKETGASGYLKAFECSFWPFAVDDKGRAEGDGRPSIASRYSSHRDYVQRISAATRKLQDDGLLLAEDALAQIDLAKRMKWPPRATNRWPFWEVEK